MPLNGTELSLGSDWSTLCSDSAAFEIYSVTKFGTDRADCSLESKFYE